MPPVIYDAKRVAVRGAIDSIEVVNVFNIRSSFTVADVAQAVGEAFADAFGPLLSNVYAFTDAKAVDMSSVTGETATHSLAAHENGDSSSAVELGLVAILRWQDTISGRGFRPGRSYFGPLPQNAVQNNGRTCAPAYMVDLRAAAEAFLEAITFNIDGDLVIVHGIGTINQQLAPVTGVSVAGLLGHLDSRRS